MDQKIKKQVKNRNKRNLEERKFYVNPIYEQLQYSKQKQRRLQKEYVLQLDSRVDLKEAIAKTPQLMDKKQDVLSEKPQSKKNDIPSISECAKLLKREVPIIAVDNRLYYYNGKCYEPLTQIGVVTLYMNFVDEKLHHAKSLKVFTELYSLLLADESIRVVVNPKSLERYAILNNGVYDIVARKLKNFSPDIIAFSYVNACYTDYQDCPVFERFLEDITKGNQVLIERMWMTIGYICSLSLEAKAFFVMGQAPNSGKSLFGKFLECLFEPQCVSSIEIGEMHKDFSLGPLVGAAINLSLDLPNAKLKANDVSKLKMLTGGDLVTINEKYIPRFKYLNRAKFVYASNHPIELWEEDDAFWERLVFLPFDYSVDISKRDPGLLEILLEEKDAIVSKSLKYARKLIKSNYKFPCTPEITARINQWRGFEMDTVDMFVQTCCEICSSDEYEILQDMYEAYMKYCNTLNRKYVIHDLFKTYLEKRYGLQHCKKRRNSQENPRSAFKGIRLNREEMTWNQDYTQ